MPRLPQPLADRLHGLRRFALWLVALDVVASVAVGGYCLPAGERVYSPLLGVLLFAVLLRSHRRRGAD